MMETGQKMPPRHGAETPVVHCSDCRWWENPSFARTVAHPMFGLGWCRRYAPRENDSRHGPDDWPVVSDWPVTDAGDFCGDAVRGRPDRRCAWCPAAVTPDEALCASCLALHHRQLAEQQAQRTGEEVA